MGSREEGELGAELQAGVTMEMEVGCFEGDEQASVVDLGLLLHSGHHLDGALKTQRVTAVVLKIDDTLTVISCGRVGAGALNGRGVPAA